MNSLATLKYLRRSLIRVMRHLAKEGRSQDALKDQLLKVEELILDLKRGE